MELVRLLFSEVEDAASHCILSAESKLRRLTLVYSHAYFSCPIILNKLPTTAVTAGAPALFPTVVPISTGLFPTFNFPGAEYFITEKARCARTVLGSGHYVRAVQCSFSHGQEGSEQTISV